MKKVYLFCTFGMSTSMLATAMQKTADKHSLPMEILAFSDSQIQKIVDEKHPDVILLGPQVAFKFDEISKKFAYTNTPIEVISAEDYGTMNGEKVLKRAIKILQEQKAKGE